MGNLCGRVQLSELPPRLLSRRPLPYPANPIRRTNEPLGDKELHPARWSIRRGNVFRQANWVESIVRRLDLESKLPARGRPKSKPNSTEKQNKDYRGRDGHC